MEKFLLLYTVGPVQSYIAQAVKLHDLYSGSRMLSKTIEIAMKKICDMEPQNKIIFPYYKESIKGLSVSGAVKIISYPNRCVAEIYADRENLKEKLENLNMEIRRELFSETFIKYLHDEYRDTDRREAIALQQLDDHFHTYWAALPFGNSEKYEEKYKELERAMGAVKNLRKFEQLSVVTSADDQTEKRDGSRHNRCKICGERTPLFINNSKNLQHNLKPGERLCAVC